MNILVTGSKGQLGTAIYDVVSSYVDKKNEYIFTDIDEFNLLDTEENLIKFIDKHQIDMIINCAAYTAVDKAQTDKNLCKLLNEDAPKKLANICKDRYIYLYHISTDYVYSGRFSTPINEGAVTEPQNWYGWTKRQGEIGVISSYCRYMIFRTSWLYYDKFPGSFPYKIKNTDKNELTVVDDQIGTPTYAGDLAYAIIDIIENKKWVDENNQPNDGVYNFSNEGVTSWYDFAKAINPNVRIIPIKTSDINQIAKRPQFSVMDKSKYKKTFKMKVPYWRDSLEKYLKNS